jgi:hypothetical protein
MGATSSLAGAQDAAMISATNPVPGAQEPAQPPAPAPTVDEAAANDKGKPAANSVFLEGMGAGLFYSINYERRVIDDLGVRAGFSYLTLSTSASAGGVDASSSASYLTIPITASYLGVRGRRSGLELGGGMTLAYTSAAASSGITASSDSGMTALGTAMVGYRLHPVDHAGFQFRVGVMALAAKGLSLSNPDPESFGVFAWFYLSAGAGF